LGFWTWHGQWRVHARLAVQDVCLRAHPDRGPRRDRRARSGRLRQGDHHFVDQHHQRRRCVAAIGIGSGNAITINAGASDNVNLRGLTIEGIGGAANGILFTSGGNLAIENCVIRGFTNAGIFIAPSTSSSFSVSDTIASNNGNIGIWVQPTGSAVVKGVLSKVTANNNNSNGIRVSGVSTTGATLNVTIVDSVASNNHAGGVVAQSLFLGTAATAVLVRNVVVSSNLNGIQ
jgi:Right handed beta helix region